MTEMQSKAERAYQLAYQYEQTRTHCIQCTLAALMDTLGQVDEKFFKAADGLAGGIANSTGGSCGALSAGIMTISSLTGRTYQAFAKGEKDHTWQYVAELYDQFVAEYGGPTCHQVQEKLFGRSYLLRDAEQSQQFVTDGGHSEKCPSVCGNVARWTILIMDKIQKERGGQ